MPFPFKAIFISFSLFAFSPLKASEANTGFKNIIVFGDSLSDNGNYLKASKTSEKPMPLPPYYEGRASNGIVWVEYISQSLKTNLIDFAYIGALTSGNNPRYPAAVDVLTQINQFIKNQNGKKIEGKDTLFVVWAGANNIFSMDFKKPVQTFKSLWNLSGDLMKGIQILKENGAQNIFIANLPDLGKIALTNDVESFKKMKWVLSSIIKMENYAIERQVEKIRDKNNDSMFKIVFFNAKKMLLEIDNKPEKFFVKNTNNSCYVGVPSDPANPNVSCNNPKDYVFWDLVHPTTKIHCFAAYEIQKTLSEEFNTVTKPLDSDQKKCESL